MIKTRYTGIKEYYELLMITDVKGFKLDKPWAELVRIANYPLCQILLGGHITTERIYVNDSHGINKRGMMLV